MNLNNFSFVRAEPEASKSLDEDPADNIPDEFAQFVNASIHPTNFGFVRRSYSEMNCLCQSNSSRRPSARPRLRRASAQDIEDVDIKPNISIELVDKDSDNLMSVYIKKRVNLGVSASQFSSRFPLHQRSAPGTPIHNRYRRSSKHPSRTDGDESGHLRVPLSQARGVSLPDELEERVNKNNLCLLRQFNIKGRKVIRVGNFYQQRSSSNTSINSNISWG